MALGNRYTFTFKSLIDGENFTVLIKQEGYGGSVETLDFLPGRSPVVLSYDKNNSNLMHPIRGSQMTVRVSLTPSQIQEFVLAGNRDWYLEVTGAQGFEWYGWLQPQTSLIYSPYGLRQLDLQFSDNLGALQNTPDSVLNDNFNELQTIRTMIERLVGYTEIDLPITIDTSVRHADEIYDYAQDTVYLEQTLTLNYDGIEPQNSYDLLSKLLRMLHCVIYQKAGNWVIENWIDKSLALYPASLLSDYSPLDRSLQVRFESPLSKVTAKSYHYQVRHTQTNRDFSDANFDGSDNFLDFPGWTQFGTLVDPITDAITINNKQYARIKGNYVASVSNSRDYLRNSGGLVTANNAVRIYVNFVTPLLTPSDVSPQFAVELIATDGGLVWWFDASTMTFIQQSTPILNQSDILNNIGDSIIAPVDGMVHIRIYRPLIPSLGTTYNPSVTYCRWAYAEVLASKTSNETDYKLFKSVATEDNRGLRESEMFETLGLAFDREFSPNGNAAFDYDDFVSLQFNDNLGVSKTTGDFISDYMPTSQPWGMTEFASNTWMRLFGKPQLFVEGNLSGKGLNVGDVYEVDIPGFATPYLFVVVAFDYDLKNDVYSTLLAYINYDSDTITMNRYWLQQSQNDIP